ncbi:leucine-rich repeats and immunoglobulin-like domains protein 3 [Leptopilina heterotoma]|uniref:leucine-rich repeats and immunoglobulin-like domains protein 3 n=1 Tax=Leptopilina heterotoma TaxID=63436 RepID=UPI001CA938E7|nr:leucine-rich repeats and immunoglobulin-like domains protein 3 [Leptopilina heterotoma]
MKKILWCLIIKIFIINGSSAEDFFFKNNELNDETSNEELQLCKDQQLSLNFANTIVTNVGKNFLTSTLISCLKMNNNGITKVSSSAFDKIPNLTYLNLANNLIEEDELLYNGNFKNLKILVLDSAYLGHNSYYNYKGINFFGNYPSLEKLYLRNNNINTVRINNYIANTFLKLTHLYLNNNTISSFSIDVKHSNAFMAIKYVNLNYNNMDSVEVNLPALEFLSFDYNKVSSLTLKRTKKLEKLYAAHNQLSEFSEKSLEQCEKLKILNLKNNQINEFSKKILEKCNSLEYLNLDNNKISKLPAINSTSYLKRFLLRCNKIDSLRSDTFSLMPHLIVLRLDGNRIFKVEANTFLTLVNLQSLTLGNNQLANLPENWSQNLKMLQNLNLENNKFKMLEDLSLTHEDVILNLNLTNNPFKQLTSNSFMVIPENATVYLNFNATRVESCLKNN